MCGRKVPRARVAALGVATFHVARLHLLSPPRPASSLERKPRLDQGSSLMFEQIGDANVVEHGAGRNICLVDNQRAVSRSGCSQRSKSSNRAHPAKARVSVQVASNRGVRRRVSASLQRDPLKAPFEVSSARGECSCRVMTRSLERQSVIVDRYRVPGSTSSVRRDGSSLKRER